MNAKMIKQIIKEEIQSLLILEKFQSKRLGKLYNMLGSGKWADGRKLFQTLAKSRGFDWANTPEAAVTISKSGATSSDMLNVFIVNSRKGNNTSKGDGWKLDIGLLGMTVGKKLSGFNANLVSNKGDRAGASYSNRGIWNFKQMNAYADEVYSINMKMIPSAKDTQAARAEAKKGATALMKAKDVAQQNKKNYQNALTMKAGAGGWKSARDYVKKAHDELLAGIAANTKQLADGKYSTGWDSHYSLATRLYENIMSEFKVFQEQNKAYLKNKPKAGAEDKYNRSGYNKDRANQAIKNMKDYYIDFHKRMERVKNDPVRSIEAAY